MWRSEDIIVTIDETLSEDRLVTVGVETPAGELQVMGEVVRLDNECLRVVRAHIQGLAPGACGTGNLIVIARKVLEIIDVEEIVIEGSARTSGANPSHTPRPFRLRKRKPTIE